MIKVVKEDGALPIKIWTNDIEDSALQQLKNLSRLPFIHPHGVVAMPDVHFGIGATIGSVIATQRAIIPAAVGVDIGCGMLAVHTSLMAYELPDDLSKIRQDIESACLREHDKNNPYYDYFAIKTHQFGEICHKYPEFAKNKVIEQMGTLGSGNHFIELCLDENNWVWIMLHSGSRGIGNRMGNTFIQKARAEMEKYFIQLPDKDLAYLIEDSELFDDYMLAIDWAQNYAFENRKALLKQVLQVLKNHIPMPILIMNEAINCHHNYVEKENHFGKNMWVTRKGAIRAREDDLGIIPGSMGQRSYIVRGKGNCDSYHSCSHGAGRAMGRNEAKKRFTVADLEQQTLGVNCRKDESVLDEIPSAYKNIDIVMENQKDLVDIMHVLKQVMCVKGG